MYLQVSTCTCPAAAALNSVAPATPYGQARAAAGAFGPDQRHGHSVGTVIDVADDRKKNTFCSLLE